MFKQGGKQGPVVEKRPKNCPNDGFLGSTLTIGGRSLLVTKFLAQGGFAFVYVATNPINVNEVYAVKRMIIQTKAALKDCLMETYYHVCFNSHPNIVKLYAARVAGHETQLSPDAVAGLCNAHLQIPSEIVLLMELCVGGSIVDVMQRAPNGRFTEDFIWNAFGRVVSTVCMMSSMGIINRDLKIENLLMSYPLDDHVSPGHLTAKHTEYIKVCDFGSCTKTQYPDGSVFTKDLALRTAVENEIQKKTTPSYRAPEMIDFFAKFPITIRSDVFALGVMLYRMMYFTLPFPDGEVLANFNCKYRLPTSPNYSEELKRLVSVSLVKDPMQRADVWYLAEIIQAKTGIQFTPRPANLTAPQLMPQAIASSPQSVLPSAQLSQQSVGTNSIPTFDFAVPATQPLEQGLTRESSCTSIAANEDAPLFGFETMAKRDGNANAGGGMSASGGTFGLQVKKSSLAAAQGFQLSSGSAAPAFRAGGGGAVQPGLSLPSPSTNKGLPTFNFSGKPMFSSQQPQPPAQPQLQLQHQAMASSPPAMFPAPQMPVQLPAPCMQPNMNSLLDFFTSGSEPSTSPQQPQQVQIQQPQGLVQSPGNPSVDLFGWNSQSGSFTRPEQPTIPAEDQALFNMMTPEQQQVYSQQLQMQQMFAMQNMTQGSK